MVNGTAGLSSVVNVAFVDAAAVGSSDVRGTFHNMNSNGSSMDGSMAPRRSRDTLNLPGLHSWSWPPTLGELIYPVNGAAKFVLSS